MRCLSIVAEDLRQTLSYRNNTWWVGNGIIGFLFETNKLFSSALVPTTEPVVRIKLRYNKGIIITYPEEL